jgi:hypothetical protein
MRSFRSLAGIVLFTIVLLGGEARAGVVTYTVQGQQVFATGTNVLGLNGGHFVYQMTLDSAATPFYTVNDSGNIVADYTPLSATITLSGTAVDGTYTATSPGGFQLLNAASGDDAVVLQTSSFTVGAGQTINATFEPEIKPGVIPNGSTGLPVFLAGDIDAGAHPPIVETFVGKNGTTAGQYQLASGAVASVPEPGCGLWLVGVAVVGVFGRRRGA